MACLFQLRNSDLLRQSADLSRWHFWSLNVFSLIKDARISLMINKNQCDWIPRWSDRVHNAPGAWQPRIVEWLKLIQRQCSVITELPVSSPWSFRVNQSQALISLWHCSQGPTERDKQNRGEDTRRHVFTPQFLFGYNDYSRPVAVRQLGGSRVPRLYYKIWVNIIAFAARNKRFKQL